MSSGALVLENLWDLGFGMNCWWAEECLVGYLWSCEVLRYWWWWVGLFGCCAGWMKGDLRAYAQDVEACEAVESVFLHDCAVCSWWFVCYESDDLLLCSDEWLKVGVLGVGGAPDGDVSDEVWVDLAVV